MPEISAASVATFLLYFSARKSGNVNSPCCMSSFFNLGTVSTAASHAPTNPVNNSQVPASPMVNPKPPRPMEKPPPTSVAAMESPTCPALMDRPPT